MNGHLVLPGGNFGPSRGGINQYTDSSIT